MDQSQKRAALLALLAAALYALSTPFSKLLLEHIPAAMMAAFLYLGAGAGLFLIRAAAGISAKTKKGKPLTRKELPYLIGMVCLDIAAPIFMMIGLSAATAANASLLSSFEIAATALIALLLFREAISKRLWLAIALVTVSSAILSFEGGSSFSFSIGSAFVLLACVCWGFENNCTRMLSSNDPIDIVVIKGFGSGLGSLLTAFVLGERLPDIGFILLALLLGFAAYGLSISFYIRAQRDLGAAKTSTYYAAAPFISSGLSLLIFGQKPSLSYFVALAILIAGTYFAATDGRKEA